MLNRQYYKKDAEEKISDVDREIFEYIKNNITDDYSEIVKKDSKWEVLYHLSELRTSILNWYDFKEDSEVLEIGGGFGAVTGLLCNKCSHVTSVESSLFKAEAICNRYSDRINLDVYAGDIKDITFNKKFDYIIILSDLGKQGRDTGNLELYINYLSNISKLLSKDGKLILAADNRYGIKYFCGAQDQHTGIAFDSINKYPNGTNGYSFSNKELKDIIEESGFSFYKFYYPLPDYRFPQLIYSEDYLPEKNVSERLIPYYLNADTLVAYENDLYDDIIDNNVFQFFANSYLVECSFTKDFCDAIYSAISIDRGKENGFITTIYKDDIVKKKAIYNEGNKNIINLYNNMKDIGEHGLNVISSKLHEGFITMPYIKQSTLSNYLKEIVKTDKEEFISIFSRIYEYILQSSEHVSEEYNALCNNETKNLKWGPILKKAYIELIPLNSFYVEGEILYFDQEFVRNNYPAKYILFRALNYIYYFGPHIEDIIPLDFFKKKYEMEDVWNIFVKEENKFLKKIRNHELHNSFYKLTAVNKKNIYNNCKRLSGEQNNENSIKFEVTPKMKRIRDVQLDLLENFINICKTHGLKYYIIYGTLLGAVRHKGYIPWDDDIDVAMPRNDYDKLKSIYNKDFKEPYFFQTPENDKECFYNGYCRLRNSNTTGISLIDIGHSCNNGIWIDILPLDECPQDSKSLDRKIKKIRIVQRLLYAKIYGKDYEKLFDMNVYEWKVYCFLSKLFSHKNLCRILEKRIVSHNRKSDYIGIFTHYGRCQRFDKRDFESTINLDFEQLKVRAPIGYDRCLRMCVGKDYMKYPPLERRKPHHRGIFDTDYPYKKYEKIYFNLFEECDNKRIIIFGAGLMFEDYMKKNGKKYAPDFLVDNDKGKWGTKRHNVYIKSPDDILKIPEENRRVIICSVYYREIEKQLKEMGIYDYKIYVQDKNWIADKE